MDGLQIRGYRRSTNLSNGEPRRLSLAKPKPSNVEGGYCLVVLILASLLRNNGRNMICYSHLERSLLNNLVSSRL